MAHIVTALLKPNPQLSQIRLGLELSNALVSTTTPPTTQTLNSLYLSHLFVNYSTYRSIGLLFGAYFAELYEDIWFGLLIFIFLTLSIPVRDQHCNFTTQLTWPSQLGLLSGIIITLYHPRRRRCTCLDWLYLRHFSTDWPEILHDNSPSGKDQVFSQNSDPAALQYYMQHWRISIHSTVYISWIELKFCIMSMWKGSNVESKQWRCSTAVFNAVLQNL